MTAYKRFEEFFVHSAPYGLRFKVEAVIQVCNDRRWRREGHKRVFRFYPKKKAITRVLGSVGRTSTTE
jgi:hypothetical protein